MSENIVCGGCCFMSKAGVIVWKCDQVRCAFNEYFFTQKEQTLDTCFT